PTAADANDASSSSPAAPRQRADREPARTVRNCGGSAPGMRIANDGGRTRTGSSTVPVRGPALDLFRMKALRMASRSTLWLMALLIVAANVLGWQWLHRPLQAPGFDGKVAGMAYNAFQRWDDP